MLGYINQRRYQRRYINQRRNQSRNYCFYRFDSEKRKGTSMPILLTLYIQYISLNQTQALSLIQQPRQLFCSNTEITTLSQQRNNDYEMLPKDNLIQVLKIFKNFYIFIIILGTLTEINDLKKLKLSCFLFQN